MIRDPALRFWVDYVEGEGALCEADRSGGLTSPSSMAYHPCRWSLDGKRGRGHPVNRQGDERAARPADSEKITINLGFVDLGNIDLLVAEGFYSNRTDLIRTAIRAQLERHADVLKQSTSRKQLDLL